MAEKHLKKWLVLNLIMAFIAIVLFFICLGINSFHSFASTDTKWQNDYEYTLDDENGIINLSKYKETSPGGDIIIPSYAIIDGKEYKTYFGTTPKEDGTVDSFFCAKNITSISVKSGAVMTCGESLFSNIFSLKYVNLSDVDTSTVTTMKKMFYGSYEIESINLDNIDTSNVEDMSYMFCGYEFYTRSGEWNIPNKLTSLSLRKFDTSKVSDMSGMFFLCGKITDLDLSGFDTSSVTNMSFMFGECKSLSNIDISSFDTTNVTNMSYMFKNCTSLESVPVEYLETQNIRNMNHMFYGCKGLKALNLNYFDTSSVNYMGYMFSGCENIKSLDLSSFDTSKVTSMDCMFTLCSNMEELDLSSFIITKDISLDYMFSGCDRLKTVNTPIVMNADEDENAAVFDHPMYESFADGSIGNEKYTSLIQAPTSSEIVSVSSEEDTEWQNNYEYLLDSHNGRIRLQSLKTGSNGGDIIIPSEAIIYGKHFKTTIGGYKRTLESSSFFSEDSIISFATEEGVILENGIYLFAGLTKLTSVDLSKADMSEATDMSAMFYNCTSLTNINFKNANTSNLVETCGVNYFTGGMFEGCSSLTEIDLSDLDTENVTSFDSMFRGCSSLVKLDLSRFDTSNVENMYHMFDGCSSLSTLDISNFDLSKLKGRFYTGIVSFSGEFSLLGCEKLEVLYTPKIINSELPIGLPYEMYERKSDNSLGSVAYTDLTNAPVSSVLVRNLNNGSAGETATMLRLYNPNNGEHFYTASTHEKNKLVSIGWQFEGSGWVGPAEEGDPVYRLYSPILGDHHYTTDASERDWLTTVGWTYEGIAWYSADPSVGKPLYRLYNPNAYDLGQSGAHHYTMSAAERDKLVSIGWIDEGIGWYGL